MIVTLFFLKMFTTINELLLPGLLGVKVDAIVPVICIFLSLSAVLEVHRSSYIFDMRRAFEGSRELSIRGYGFLLSQGDLCLEFDPTTERV